MKRNKCIIYIILKKKKAKQNDIEKVRNEIDVMRLYHYPNVVHLKQKWKSVYESNNKIVEVDV